MRVIASAVLVFALLAFAGPRTHHAIAALRGEFAALDMLAAPAAATPARPSRWVPISDRTAVLAREQAQQRVE